MRPLNFASQPFRNERLPVLLFGAASAVLLAATVHHALVVRALLPARTSKLHQEVAGLEGELDRLRAEGRTLTAPKLDKQAIEEWVVLKDLVDRRTFSWTGLFARSALTLPEVPSLGDKPAERSFLESAVYGVQDLEELRERARR